MQDFYVLLLCLSMFQAQTRAFAFKAYLPRESTVTLNELESDGAIRETSRRSFLDKLACTSVASALCIPANSANASGGATAGGAYLLSAKQRYNERVRASVKELLAVEEALAAGSSKEAKTYFAGEATGSWKDLTAAGYLLSNAFRRSSTTPPDSLPAVKKYKAFAAEVDKLQKILKKKGAPDASAMFPEVEEALESWLTEIELPPAREL